MEDSSYYDEAFNKADSEPSLFEPETTMEQVIDAPVTVEEESYLTNGHKTLTVKIGSHEIILRTLKIGEEFEVALASDKFKDTIEGDRSYCVAAVAAAIVTIDGKPLIDDPLLKSDQTIEGKYNYLLKNYYWPAINSLYEDYAELMREQQKVINTIKKG